MRRDTNAPNFPGGLLSGCPRQNTSSTLRTFFSVTTTLPNSSSRPWACPANELLQIEKSRLSDIRRFEHRARGRRARKFYGKACRSYRRQFRSGTGDCSRVVRRGGPRCVLKFRVVTWYNATPSLPVCCHLQPVNSHLRPVNGARGDLPISHGPPRSVPNFSHPVLPNRGQGTRRR